MCPGGLATTSPFFLSSGQEVSDVMSQPWDWLWTKNKGVKSCAGWNRGPRCWELIASSGGYRWEHASLPAGAWKSHSFQLVSGLAVRGSSVRDRGDSYPLLLGSWEFIWNHGFLYFNWIEPEWRSHRAVTHLQVWRLLAGRTSLPACLPTVTSSFCFPPVSQVRWSKD